MVWQQLKSKAYWQRVAGYFVWLVLTYTLVSYFFREADEPFWSLKEIQSRFGFAFFMAVIFSYRGKEPPPAALPDDEEVVKQKWTIKDFFGMFGLMLLFAVFIMLVLFGIGWLVVHLLDSDVEPIGKTLTRMLLSTVVMTFFATLVLFLCDKYGIRWGRRT